MTKCLVTAALILVFAAPAMAAPRDFFPVSCDDLWAAVNVTLSDAGNYSVSSIDDVNKKAAFIVVGELIVYTDTVALIARDNGCQAKLTIKEVGAENSNYRSFRKRLVKSLAKVEAAKSPAPAKPAGPGQ